MNLLEFVTYLKDSSKIEGIVQKQNPELDIDYADIYLENELNIYSEMSFFNAEKIEGKIEMEFEGKKYINLFPLDYLQDVFADFNIKGKNDLEIANDILSFRINDA